MKRTPLKRTPFRSKPKPMRQVSEKKAEEIYPLRENAEGKPCTLRLPGCRFDPQYTIFAHYRRFGWAGMAQKPNDMLGAFSCDVCHEKQERNHPDCTYEDMLRAMGETLMIQQKSKLILVKEISNE